RGVPRPLPGRDRGRARVRRGPDRGHRSPAWRTGGRRRAVRPLRAAHPAGAAGAPAARRGVAFTGPHGQGCPMTADADRARAPGRPRPGRLAPGQPVPESPAPVHPGHAQPALDQTERVILRSAEEGPGSRGEVVVVGDTTGELTAAALARTEKHAGARVWSWNFSHAESAALTERFAAQCANGRLRVAGGDQPLDLE